ncbi:MAG: hypothetical protein H6Q17_1828 [Bacteroidetes bacterium]|nr:hypothetical protein [Bacteroidota bacterium]
MNTLKIKKLILVRMYRICIVLLLFSLNILTSKSQTGTGSSFEIQNWNANEKIQLPDSLSNISTEGVVVMKLYFSTKNFRPLRLGIIRFRLIDKASKKVIFYFNKPFVRQYDSKHYPPIIQRYYPFLMEYVKSLKIIKTDSSYRKAESYIVLSREW